VTTSDTTSASSPGIAFNIDGIPLNRGIEQAAALTQTNGNVGGAGSGYANWDTLNSAVTGGGQRIIYGNPFPNRIDDTFSNFDAQFNWAIGPVHLAYVGGYFNYSGHDLSSSTNNPLGNGDGTTTTYQWTDNLIHVLTDSQELRLSNQVPGFADWVAGVNWYHEHIRNDIRQWGADQTTPDTVPNVAGSQPLFDFLSNATQEAKEVFGQTTLHLGKQWD
jgi:hypothetical protein